MAERTWTDEQTSAIETTDKTLLVSAAAGSGKTATLTERIIRSLKDEKSNVSVDSLLVVTFTKAAAGELRSKISKALAEAVVKKLDDSRLQRQLYLLPAAKISTIDSFCNEILRSNCDRAGVPPGYRIADAAECELLAISIIEGLIEAVYNGLLPEVATPDEFEELADCLTDSKRVEELSEVFRHIHHKCENALDGIYLLRALRENYNVTSVDGSIYGRYIDDRLREMLSHYMSAYAKYKRIFESGNDAEQKYLKMVKSDLEIMKKLAAAKDYSSVREVMMSYSLMDKPRVSKDRTADMDEMSILRDMFRKDIIYVKTYYSYTEEMWLDLYKELYRLLGVFCRFEEKFDELFSEEKRRRGAFSYADIERYTYNCLVEDGKPTDLAMNIRNQFSAIYIDEYQDVNALQDSIFEAISKPNNRFMVGDIKQSIYSFRSACPEIFARMKTSFPPLAEAEGDCASIFMSRNFRCDKGVVDYVNNIFDRVFSFVGKSIGYQHGDRLGYAKIQEHGEPPYRYPKLCLVDKQSDLSNPQVVARKIKELLDSGRLNNGDPISCSDICIILREAKGRDILYAEALSELGIPSCIAGAKDFFLSSEVLLALCLLNTIDNPRRDIYLAGLLCSPLFSFTADDLCRIRSKDAETLYESLLAYTAENPDFAKGVSFLKTLDYYRAIAEGVGVDTLIHKLYHETGLLALASKNGGKDNLMLLYDYSRDYEAGSYKGLYNFISFLNNIINKKTNFDDPRAVSGVDAVKIVTSHGSKGLEYPVVFYVYAEKVIYNKERTSRLAFSEDFGFSFKLRTPSGLAMVESPVQKAVNHFIERKLFEEELRVLYVALTRAREQLYVVGRSPIDDRDEYISKMNVIKDNLSEYALRGLSSYQEIIIACEGSVPLTEEEFCDVSIQAPDKTVAAVSAAEESKDDLTELLKERFAYKYPRAHRTTLPEKLSVSLISPGILDGTDGETVMHKMSEEETDDEKPTLPTFITGTDAGESAKRGIATHYFMQFFDLEELAANGAENELKRLVKKGYISKEDEKRVRIKEIEAFVRSDLFLEMQSAKRVHKEFRFNLLLPASQFAESKERAELYKDESILVQGVIDCIIERADGSLALYDYKTDRLTREERKNPSLGAARLREKHKDQLNLYAVAVEKIFGKSPDTVKIYSLALGDTVDIKE